MTKGLLILSLVLTFSLQAQEKTVSGTIIDVAGMPLPGATIAIKGTSTGVSSDFDGNYSIDVKENDVLTISFIGFVNQEISVTGKSTINITLLEDANLLDEVVVVGFGTQKRENVTGAASFIKMDAIMADRPIVNSAQALQGVAAGLQVVSTSGAPGATGTSINIRGMNSINGGSPLILVDNVPMSLGDVNPRDIESVSVLKDAAASSIYGSRAAFGVVLITTKKSKRNEAIKFSYSSTVSFSNPSDLPEKATTKEFVNALKDFGVDSYFAGQDVDKWSDYLDMYDADPSQLTYLKDPITGTDYPITYDLDDNTYYPLADSDIIGDFLNNVGYSTIHNFTISGGSDKISYRLNTGYSYEDGVMVTDRDSYKKFNVNAYIESDLSSKLKSATTIYYRNSERSRPVATFNNAIQQRMYDPTGFFEAPNGDAIPFDSPGNTVRYRTPGTTNNDNLRFFQKLDFTPIKNLTITGEYTFRKSFTNSFSSNNGTIFASTFKFIPNISPETSFLRSNVNKSSANTVYNALNMYAKYDFAINNHKFNALVGLNKEESVTESIGMKRNGLVDPTLPSFNLAIGEDFDMNDSYRDWGVIGYFSRLNYNYKEKYFLEMNGRIDGSSRFAEGDRYILLPSFSGGWNIAKEDFMESVDFLSMLKLRGSWGEIGNQNVTRWNDDRTARVQDYYPSILGYEDFDASWVNLGTGQQYLSFSEPGLISGGFTWEKVRTTNIGLDAAFLSNRLSASVDLYSRETLGMLAAALELPGVLGTDAPNQNIADLQTRGWEVELRWKDEIGNFNYGLNFNLSNNESKITRFNNEAGLIGNDDDKNSNYFVGGTIGDIWGYVTDGYYTVADFEEGTLDAQLSGAGRTLKDGVVQIENAPTPYPGDIKYSDLNGDGVINSGNATLEADFDPETGEMISNTGPGDRKVIGNNNRKYQYGINGYASYKGFDFSFVLSGVGKRDLWRNSDLVFPYPSLFDHIYKHQLDYWTPDNLNAYYPRVYGDPNGNVGTNYGRSRRVQTKYLSDESYLRIQNISFGYTFSKEVLDKINLNNLRVFVSGDNIHTFDKLPKGLDPDQGSNGVYPIMTNYSVGINLSF